MLVYITKGEESCAAITPIQAPYLCGHKKCGERWVGDWQLFAGALAECDAFGAVDSAVALAGVVAAGDVDLLAGEAGGELRDL